MSSRVAWKKTADRPTLDIWWFNRAGALIDFSAGYSFSLKVGNPGETALLTKSTNIAGAAGAGFEPTGTPNIVVTWAGGDLNLAAGSYTAELTATTTSLDRVLTFQLDILEVNL